MLVTNKRTAAKYDNIQQVAISTKGDEVYCVDCEHDDPPACRSKNVLQLLTNNDWLEVTKKFRLSNKSIRRLKRFWTLGESEFQTDSPREQWAFQALEAKMLAKMKTFHNAKRGVKYLPFHDASPNNDSVCNHIIIGATSSGKTTFAGKLLTQEDSLGNCYAKNRPIVCFAVNKNDPSLAAARKMHKKNWVDVDYQKLASVGSRLSLEMLPKGCLCIFDDSLEVKGDMRTRLLYDLVQTICTRGRHHRGKKRGTEALVITHYMGARQLRAARNSARYWTLFPYQKQQCVHILKSRLSMTKREIEKLLANCRGSRTATFDMWHPMKLISENHCELL